MNTHACGAELGLLDLGFLELDVLFGDRIVLLEHQFFGARTWVLLGDIEEACACSREELDLLGDGLGHGRSAFWCATAESSRG